ncbi:tetratricopeptide repeat protein 16 [Elgaria multicarinata webbii]|uniref:tetratricopeptide repeat protein 16 n=1 Tax=Elgaria multicarinata webbii TaxID=159646 RepID=UPI002FCD1294
MEEEEKVKEEKKEQEVKLSTVYLGFFPTAVTEEKLEEARQKSLRHIFGSTGTLRYIRNPTKVGTFEGILQNRIKEHCRKGNKYFFNGEWEKAITCFTKALNLDPGKLELYEKKAEALLQLCDFQSAAMHLRKAYLMSSMKESIGARLAFIFHLQGQCLYEQKIFVDALESFMRASEVQPQTTLYRMRSVACLAALKRYNDCLQMVNEEVAREKTNPDLFVLRAWLYEYFGKATFTFFNLRDALALDPEHSEARAMLAKLRKEAQKSKDEAVNKAVKGNLQASLLKINRAIDYNPVEAKYFLFRGNILRRLKDFSAAIDDYLKAVDLCQEEEEGSEVRAEAQKQVLLTYNDFAVHCYARGCYEEAALLLNKAIKGEKNQKELYSNRGDCFLKLGELNFAMADYQQALELRPLDSRLQKRVARLHNEMGMQEFRERRYPQAEAYFSHAVENNPREMKYYLHRAKSRMFLQEMMGAKEDIITALLLNPSSQEVHALAQKLFPGEPILSMPNSKVGAVAKAVLDRRLAACPACEVLAQQESPEPRGTKPPSRNVYVENEDLETADENEEMEQVAEERRLYQKLTACQKKTHAVEHELKEAREKGASVGLRALRLDPYPHLPEKQRSGEPYQWRKFGQGIGHF